MKIKPVFRKISFLLFISLLVGVAGVNSAQAATDTVSILPTIVSRCGDQQTYATGTATYAQVANRDLVVKLDGVVVYSSPRYVRPTTWTTGLFAIATGQHTITAYIYRNGAHTLAAATATQAISIDSCTDHPGASNDKGKSEPAIPAKIQYVINHFPAIFKSVFGKKLNKVETTYWKNRAIGKGEKYTVINLKKEMLSLKKQGRTMPKAVIKAKILKVNVAKK